MTIKAIGLMSGGLDSCLAVRVLQEQGIEVIGIHCLHPFHMDVPPGQESHAVRVARELGIELCEPDVSEAMVTLVLDPPHGRGKHLNPCVDCRILYLRAAEKLRIERGAQFLFTGEVLGQRPMSQRADSMNVIDRDSDLRGRVLRPLCARRLKPTEMEERGLVDRARLLDFVGRGRHAQMELARHYGLKEWSAPAGGCLLTFVEFSAKALDLLRHGQFNTHTVALLKTGRHFRLNADCFVAMGKEDAENTKLERLAGPDDLVLRTTVAGPLAVVWGRAGEAEILLTVALLGRYTKKTEGGLECELAHGRGPAERTVRAMPLSPLEAEKYRI